MWQLMHLPRCQTPRPATRMGTWPDGSVPREPAWVGVRWVVTGGTAANPRVLRRKWGLEALSQEPGQPGGHVPVMLDRVLELLAPALSGPDPVAVDANLGLGGHAEALLAA